MSAKPVVVVEIFDTSIDKVWDALTTKAAFDKWYFDIDEFVLEEGFEFEFYGGSYLHHCKIVDFAPQSKLVYTCPIRRPFRRCFSRAKTRFEKWTYSKFKEFIFRKCFKWRKI